jgi:hypothetical protein
VAEDFLLLDEDVFLLEEGVFFLVERWSDANV